MMMTEDPGFISLIPTLVVFILAVLTRRPIESLVSGSLVGLVMLNGSQFISGFAETSIRVMTDPEVAWVILVCGFMGGLIGILIRTGATDVHPLLFSNRRGEIVRINPGAMAAGGKQGGTPSRIAVRIFQLLMPLLSTSKPRARLRMTEYRGKMSATMIYDQLPVNDVFRKLDDNTVIGVMDNRDVKDPFFFKLRRDNS